MAPLAGGSGRRQLQSALDCGPTTVTGERPSLVDPVVQELGALLEANAGQLQEGQVEVEVRLGIVAPPHDQAARTGPTGQRQRPRENRVDLPCTSEAILSRRSGFKYHFAPGLPVEAFMELTQRLDEMCSQDLPADKRVECGQTFEHMVDSFYKDHSATPSSSSQSQQESRIRFSRRVEQDASGESGGQPSSDGRATLKRRLGQLDLYAGRRPGFLGPAFDLRAAVSTEVPVDFVPSANHREEMRREKMRKMYHFRAWRIDISTVSTTYAPAEGSQQRLAPPVQSHEVEIELDSFHLQRNLDAKLAGKPHKLWELLSDFLFTARDLAAIAGEIGPLRLPPALLPPGPEVEEDGLDEDSRAAFSRRYGNIVEPVLGQYLYRLVVPRGEPLPPRLPEPVPPTPPAQPEAAAPPPEAAPAFPQPGAKRAAPSGPSGAAEAAAAAKVARADPGQEAPGFEEMDMDSGSSSPEAEAAGRPADSWVQVSKDWEDAMGF